MTREHQREVGSTPTEALGNSEKPLPRVEAILALIEVIHGELLKRGFPEEVVKEVADTSGVADEEWASLKDFQVQFWVLTELGIMRGDDPEGVTLRSVAENLAPFRNNIAFLNSIAREVEEHLKNTNAS